MEEEKNLEPQQPEEQEPYIPASRSKRVAAWIALIGMVILVLLYTYSIATGAFLLW